MGELITTTFTHVYGLPTLNLRFFMVYGPRQPSTGAYAIVTGVFVHQFDRGEHCKGSAHSHPPNLTHQIHLDADQPLTIEGDGTHYRDFIHVDDIVRGLIMGYQSPVNGTTINLGTGNFATVHEVADLVSKAQVGKAFQWCWSSQFQA
jgi:nucleoside-diphosphate-sugar epimerase